MVIHAYVCRQTVQSPYFFPLWSEFVSGQARKSEGNPFVDPSHGTLTCRHLPTPPFPLFLLITLLTKVDMQPPPHQESTIRQQHQQQRDHSNTPTTSRPTSGLASHVRNGQADSHGDTELSSTGTNFRAAPLAALSEQQSTNQHPLHTRPPFHGHNSNLRTTASSNGNSTNKSSTDRATTSGVNAAAAAMCMGDGIINQSMKEDLDSKPTESRR